MTYLQRSFCILSLIAAGTQAAALPAQYYRLMEAGCTSIQKHLDEQPSADLKTIEKAPEHHAGSSLEISWAHFGYAILPPAVLYARQHPANARYHDPKMLALAIRIGDLLADADEKDEFEPRLDSDWDAYTWLEAYRLLAPELGEARKERWKERIMRNAALLVPNAIDRLDSPWYQSPYILTSPNHYAQWASLLLLSGRTFGNEEWEKLGARILKRFAATEQSADGYWGEHNNSGPTTGYNHLTLQSVGLYWEVTHDTDALAALRRSTTFHENFTFLDGTPVDVINDRNRHWGASSWAHFVFSNFPDGRGYAEFLADFFDPEHMTMNLLGRIAQDALYYHEGPTEPAPQRLADYHFQMNVPAGIRKTGPWQVALSGIMSTQAVHNQYYLDRQGNVSVFHQKAGLIVTGAGSKRQPELATFSQTIAGQTTFMPISTRLRMGPREDRLSLAYNTFYSDLLVPVPSENKLELRFKITERSGPTQDGRLTLQLVLKSGEVMETGAGKKITLGAGPHRTGTSGPWRLHPPSWLDHAHRSHRKVGLAGIPVQSLRQCFGNEPGVGRWRAFRRLASLEARRPRHTASGAGN